MGTDIMENLLLCCFVALIIPAHSLKCHSCVGDFNDCTPTEVTCPGKSDRCSTSAMYIDSFPCKMRKVFRGCINSTTTSKKISISPNDLITMSLQQDMCRSDLCNTHDVSDPDLNPNDLYCHSCVTPGTGCDSDSMKEMRCRGQQNQCLDMQVVGTFGEIADVNLKGCGRIPACKQDMHFISQTTSVSIQCCKENYCNSGTDSENQDKTPNGVQCYSCNTLDGANCSPEEVVKAQCYGSLTHCLEASGIYMKDERPVPTVIKGCATPSMCDSSLLPLLQKLGTATVKCCKGSLCNNQFTETGLLASGYIPTENAPTVTGIQNTSSDATSGGSSKSQKQSDSSVKTGHHADSKCGLGSILALSSSNKNNYNDYGLSDVKGPHMSPGNSNSQGVKGGSWNSNSNNGNPNPLFNSNNEFSNIGSAYNPSIPKAQDDQGIPYNELSVKNPHSVHDSNIFPVGDQTTDNDAIFGDSQIVSSPMNNSLENTNVLSPGGSALGGEGVSDTTNYSDENSIPDAPPTFPDFTSYGDNSIVPNSYNDNNMNYPNNNDFSGYEGAGFTEVVYMDNEDHPSSPTVASNNIATNSYDSVGNFGSSNSAYNPNIISSANNETSGHSADAVNIGSNVNLHDNSVQHLTPTTPQTHDYDINQQIPGHGTNAYNMGNVNNNDSGYNISSSGNNTAGSGTNYSEVIFNDSANVPSPSEGNHSELSPGGSGGEVVSSITNNSNSDISSVPIAFPTFPDYINYGDDGIVPNSNYDNNMNNPNNNDFSNYESAGFTEVAYGEVDNEQPISPTVAADIYNHYNSIGSQGTDNSADNQNILLTKNNGTTGYSADIVKNGSQVNRPEIDDNIQDVKPKTYDSDISQQIPGYDDDLYDTGVANSNCSGKSISSGNNTAGSPNNSSGYIFTGIESHNVSSQEGTSSIFNYSNSSESSIPDAPPTFPDFTSYGDNSIIPNSNHDNNMNNPNNNDFSSYEGAGFTEIVYTDMDWNVDQSSSPTVATDNTVFNSHNSVGNYGSDNSAYNPNVISSANNETSGHSADIVNVQENNGSVQQLTPTISMTHDYDINQQLSGHGINIFHTGNANINGSETNISSSGNNTTRSENNSSAGVVTDSENHNVSNPINYSSGQNNSAINQQISAIDQQISEYPIKMFNTGSASTNNSGNNISSSENNTAESGDSSSAGTVGSFTESVNHNVSSPISYSSGGVNHSELSPGGLGGEGASNITNYNNNNESSIPDAPPTFPDFTSYDDNSIVPSSYPDNSMNNPNNNDFSSNESAGFTEVTYVDIDWNHSQSNSTTVAPGISSNYDSIDKSGSNISENNPNISLTHSNETSGYSTDTQNNSNNINVQGHYGSAQNVTPATPNTQNSGVNQQISEYPIKIFNTGSAYTNNSGNNISLSENNTAGSGDSSSASTVGSFTESINHNVSSPISYSSGGVNHIELSPGGLGGEGAPNITNYSYNNENSIPDAPPTFPDFTSYGNNSIVPNSNNEKNLNNPNNNDFGNYESAGFTEIAYADMDWHDNHPTVAPGGIVSNSYGSVGNSGSDNSAYNNPIVISSNNSNETSGYLGNAVNTGSNVDAQKNHGSVQHLTPASSKTHNSGIKQHISGYGTDNNHNSNNNGSGNYISSSGNITAGNGNNSSAGTTGSSSFGGSTNMHHGNETSTTNTTSENDDEMTDELYDSNNSSYDNMEHSNFGNGTGMNSEWINSNDSSHNVGYNNILGKNHPSTSYTGNGTGMSDEWSNINSSNPHTSVPGGYVYFPGSNNSSTSNTSSGVGTGMNNEWINNSSSNHDIVSPGTNYGPINNDGTNSSNSAYNSNYMVPNNGNGSSVGIQWDSIESYLNHDSSGANNNGTFFNASSWSNGLTPGGNSFSNATAWMYSLNNELNMMPNNNNNGSSSSYNDIQNFFSTLNGYVHGNGTKNITEWFHNNSFFSNLMPSGMNHNGSGPLVNNKSLTEYFKNIGLPLNNSNIPSIISLLSSGNNGSFNISNLSSGWNNFMHNLNGMSSGGYSDNTNQMGHGLNRSVLSGGSNSGDVLSNSYNPNGMVPGRSTNDSVGGGGGAGGENGDNYSSASCLWTKSWSIFSAIVLLILNWI